MSLRLELIQKCIASLHEQVEAEAVNRAIVIVKETRCPVLFWNVTSSKAIKLIAEAKMKGKTLNITLKAGL